MRKQAQKEGRVIFYGDESSFLLNPLKQRSYSPVGKTQHLPLWDKGFKSYMVCAAISEKGQLVYTHQKKPYDGEAIVEFLKVLIKQTDIPVTLIWDGASIHHCKIVQEFLETLPEGRLLLVKQPSYSPELNASEQVWNYLKNVIMKNQVFPTVKKLGRKLKQILREFKNKKSIIKKFFENPDVAFY
ncbi:hypothetical protein M23134_08288 [Microscilla marina ATCC 23134]|uniref:Tc1-like transposase DDE domain-containing protein n=1 Tax=Microscilla marina ATCC 23134 TaxID=313606 RepID=A1ZQG4_MICM2|nr:hypothetical protein M23134_04636 [Microscilla marina ATCC 23134]EAY27336.1 hypothetical protein M23134_08288 [Microscilla marina ATCC 23134]